MENIKQQVRSISLCDCGNAQTSNTLNSNPVNFKNIA